LTKYSLFMWKLSLCTWCLFLNSCLSKTENSILSNSLEKIEILAEWTLWKNDAHSAFALTFDDGRMNHAQVVAPLIEKHGFKGTFFLSGIENYHSNRVRLFRELVVKGHEIGNHGLEHWKLTELTGDSLIRAIADGKKMIQERLEISEVFSFAYPFCLYNDRVVEMVQNFHQTARSCGKRIQNDPECMDMGDFYEFQGIGYTIPKENTHRVDFEEEMSSVEKYVNNIKKNLIPSSKFGIFVAHDVVPFDSLSTNTTKAPYSIEALEYLLKELKQLEEQKLTWVTTYGDAVKYMMQRAWIDVVVKEKELNHYRVKITPRVEIGFQKVPMSLRLHVPDEHENLKISVNGKIQEGYEVQFSPMDRPFVLLDLMPGEQEILVEF